MIKLEDIMKMDLHSGDPIEAVYEFQGKPFFRRIGYFKGLGEKKGIYPEGYIACSSIESPSPLPEIMVMHGETDIWKIQLGFEELIEIRKLQYQ